MKTCTKCGDSKDESLFFKQKIGRDGLSAACKACEKARQQIRQAAFTPKQREARRLNSAAWREVNREQDRANARRWAAENAERKRASESEYRSRDENRSRRAELNAAWRQRNAEYHRANALLWNRNNRERKNANVARREAQKIKAIPGWADEQRIREFYKAADFLGMVTGEWYQVDHVVPLMSPLVCGLHCEQNLRVVTRSENASKSNRYWPDMPQTTQRELEIA